MHEYEFRLVVQCSSTFDHFFKLLNFTPQKQVVYYVKPHFRYKNNAWETKRIESVLVVYHDSLWFKWIHSIETPFKSWSRSTCKLFLHKMGDFQDPVSVEKRDFVQIDDHAQLYTFHDGENYKLVFEWEHGTFKKSLKDNFDKKDLLKSLSKYKYIYDLMTQNYKHPPYQLNENVSRKPVTNVSEIIEGEQYLFAHKLDGIFGFVYSYSDKVKQKWEGYECVIHDGTLGDGIVFAAEKMETGQVFLLDVYQVRGYETAKWCRKKILLEFLPKLILIDGYFVQTYVTDKNALACSTSFKTDGVIIHDIDTDIVFKHKLIRSIDLVYFKGYFHLPDDRVIKCLKQNLENGCVYEISTVDGEIIRKRPDRFKGNSKLQVENILSHGWNGPPITARDKKVNKRKKKMLQKIFEI